MDVSHKLIMNVSLLSLQPVSDHLGFVITVFVALGVFVLLFLLVCVEPLFQRCHAVFSLLVWGFLITMAFVFAFIGGAVQAWEQLLSNVVVFICANLVGVYHKTLTERALQNTCRDGLNFSQSRGKLVSEKKQQEHLLLSVLPAYIALEMKAEIIKRLKDKQPDLEYSNNFHNLYVKQHKHVRWTQKGPKFVQWIPSISAAVIKQPLVRVPVQVITILLILIMALLNFDTDRSYAHIGIMVEFAITLMGKLDYINKHSFNDFKLRIEETADILQSLGYSCSLRGVIQVKGKGDLQTYFVEMDAGKTAIQLP
ncbi:UNVERIFIED_CONTAM: hypothetical protein FKN15_047365 [Acipenser sinensis]